MSGLSSFERLCSLNSGLMDHLEMSYIAGDAEGCVCDVPYRPFLSLPRYPHVIFVPSLPISHNLGTSVTVLPRHNHIKHSPTFDPIPSDRKWTDYPPQPTR
jgi:hypothetical protein